MIRRILDQPSCVNTRTIVRRNQLIGVDLALLDHIIKCVLKLRDLDEAEVREPLEAIARIRKIAVCQHPCHHTMPNVDS